MRINRSKSKRRGEAAVVLICVLFITAFYYYLDEKILSVLPEKLPLHVMLAAESFCSFLEIIPFVVFVCIAAVSAGRNKWRMIGQIIVATILSALILLLMKRLAFKPHLDARGSMHWFELMIASFLPAQSGSSFPASAVALAFVFVGIVSFYFPSHKLILYIIGCFITISFILLRISYPSCSIAGGLVGYISSQIVVYFLTPALGVRQ